MRRLLFVFCLLLIITGLASAQDEPTPYDIALERIEAARRSGTWHLTLYDMRLTNLTELPATIGQLDNLHTLILTGNNLETLPPEIGNLSNLEVLRIDSNNLHTLPSEIGNLSNLRELRLRYNNLTELPIELGRLPNLRRLDVGLNPLTYPPPEIVEQGNAAIINFLRDEYEQREAERQRLLLMGVSGLGLLAAIVLGFRMKQGGGRKVKAKRDMTD